MPTMCYLILAHRLYSLCQDTNIFFVDNTKLYNLHVLNGYYEKTGSYNLASLSKIIKPPSSRAKIPVQTFIASKPTILPLYHSETQIRSPSLNCYTLYLYLCSLFVKICQTLFLVSLWLCQVINLF